MIATLDEIKTSAMELPPSERSELIAFLQQREDDNWAPTPAFLEVLKRRHREMVNGEVECLSHEEVLQRLGKKP